MAKFEPGKDGGGGGGGSEAVPAGHYLLGLTYFTRKQSKRRTDYLRCCWEVIAGPALELEEPASVIPSHSLVGKSLWCNISLDVENSGAARRLNIWCEGVGVTQAFELGSIAEGTQEEGDREIQRLFKHRGIRAKVKRETSGQYTNNDIEQFTFPKSWTAADRQRIADWERKKREKEDDFGDPAGGGTSEAWQDRQADQGWSAPSDDDIPF